ncbi:hypothetical protein EJ08DRAFT_698635 [Tothia fuscella]|uniref:Uncharacterized protein n=1 Tax=Tothia fuscella TaxID=1048955 RepID=A0A9P4NNF9_9PEZI|nr:hypothetical protein EJ08DRAFT_698635 [Tothia fuscella]
MLVGPLPASDDEPNNSVQYQCDNTPLTPDNFASTATCPIQKSQLVTGDWSLVILSNNGNGDSIAYQRDFSLIVGPQITTTDTIVAMVSEVSTPLTTVTVTATSTDLVTLPAVTTTVASVTRNPTRTITPQSTIITTTKVHTINNGRPIFTLIKTTHTVDATCTVSLPRKDRKATISPTIPGFTVKWPHKRGLPTPVARRMPTPDAPVDSYLVFKGRSIPYNKAEFNSKRRANLAKRAPDSPIVTVTDPIVSTATTTIVAGISTITTAASNTVQITSTITPAVVTIASGKTVVFTTVTAVAKTKTVTKYSVVENNTGKTFAKTVTFTKTVIPEASVSACKRRHGFLH